MYSTPIEVLEKMLPQGAKIVLSHDEHRFLTTWVGTSEGIPLDLKGKYFSRSFNANKPWKQALSECHHRLWEKWSFVAAKGPLPAGVAPQEPGKVPEDVLLNLEPFIQKLPEKKSYSSK